VTADRERKTRVIQQPEPAAAPRLSVLVTTLDGADVVGAALRTLAEQDWDGPWEVVVADNGSTDDTLRVVEAFRPRLPALQVVDASTQPGRSAALNAAAAAARGDSLAFVDQDDEVAPGWLAALVAALEEADLVGARLDHRALNPVWTLMHRGEPQSEELPRLPGARYAHSWGCAIGVRREWHERIGGADQAVGNAEDLDYCWRVQEAGGRLAFAPAAVVRYRHRTRVADIYRQSRSYGRSTTLLRASPRWHGVAGPAPTTRQELRAWAGLVKRLPVPPDRRRLGLFAWILGERVGSWRAQRELASRRRAPAGGPAG
jgi:glycosyltransferase involved in cell wall biosynthesis